MNAAFPTLARVTMLAVLASWLVAGQVVGQSPRAPARQPNYVRSTTSPTNPLRTASYQSAPTKTATVTRTATAHPTTNAIPTSFMEGGTEVVDGGTYYEDPKTGRLIPTQSAEHAAALGAASGGQATRQSPTRIATRSMPQAARTVQSSPVPTPVASEPVEMSGEMIEMGLVDEFYEGDSCGSCGGCGECADCCLTPCAGFLPMGNLQLFTGSQGFTGPMNRGSTGSFGFHQGLNFGLPLPSFGCMGGQFGFRAVETNLSGADFTNNSRNQGFMTAGLFRRVDLGLQGGVVVDWMTQSWYSDVDLTQVRGELSWVFDGCHDIGFWFTSSSATSTVQSTFDPASSVADAVENWSVKDVYAFFYRHQFGACQDGEARLFAGWTGDSDGLIGVDMRLPLATAWALEGGVTYLVPQQGAGIGLAAGHAQESWNVGLSLVWTPGAWGIGGDRYYRPLFRVADNGNFFIQRD